MAEFIFTEEGRTSLVSQNGGVRMAAVGCVFIQGIAPDDDLWEKCEKITLDTLLSERSITLGLKGVSYKSMSDGSVKPENRSEYASALENIADYLFPVTYVPARQIAGDINYAAYGSYRISYDSMSFMWDKKHDVDQFMMVALISKQYAETDDATFNVDRTQKPVVLGVAKINKNDTESDVVFLADQNDFLTYSLDLVFTVTDEDNMEIKFDQGVEEDYDKLDLVNNGLKTSGLAIAEGDDEPVSTLGGLGLNPAGGFATRRSLMVADALGATDAENQWNAAGLVHIANKCVDGNYRKQMILSTYKKDENDLRTCHVGIELTCGDTNTPAKFTVAPIDEAQPVSVDLFGFENDIKGYNGSIAIRSSGVSADSNNNVFIGTSAVSSIFSNTVSVGGDHLMAGGPNQILLGSYNEPVADTGAIVVGNGYFNSSHGPIQRNSLVITSAGIKANARLYARQCSANDITANYMTCMSSFNVSGDIRGTNWNISEDRGHGSLNLTYNSDSFSASGILTDASLTLDYDDANSTVKTRVGNSMTYMYVSANSVDAGCSGVALNAYPETSAGNTFTPDAGLMTVYRGASAAELSPIGIAFKQYDGDTWITTATIPTDIDSRVNNALQVATGVYTTAIAARDLALTANARVNAVSGTVEHIKETVSSTSGRGRCVGLAGGNVSPFTSLPVVVPLMPIDSQTAFDANEYIASQVYTEQLPFTGLDINNHVIGTAKIFTLYNSSQTTLEISNTSVPAGYSINIVAEYVGPTAADYPASGDIRCYLPVNQGI